MVELTNAEIDEVSGALGWSTWVSILDAVIEFGTGFVDGVNAAEG